MTDTLAADRGPVVDPANTRVVLRQIALLAAVAIAAFTSYCIGYTLIAGGVVHPLLSITWAAAAVVPWVLCWPAVRRALRRAEAEGTLRWAGVMAPPVLAAIAAAALERASALAFGVEHASTLGELAFRKVPVVVGVVLVVRLYVHVARSRVRDPAVPGDRAERPSRVATPKGQVDVRPCGVDWVKAAGNYLELYSGGRCHLVRGTLKRFAADGPDRMLQIHRSILVHRDRVVRLERYPRGRLAVCMQDGRALPVGRGFRAEVERVLGE